MGTSFFNNLIHKEYPVGNPIFNTIKAFSGINAQYIARTGITSYDFIIGLKNTYDNTYPPNEYYSMPYGEESPLGNTPGVFRARSMAGFGEINASPRSVLTDYQSSVIYIKLTNFDDIPISSDTFARINNIRQVGGNILMTAHGVSYTQQDLHKFLTDNDYIAIDYYRLYNDISNVSTLNPRTPISASTIYNYMYCGHYAGFDFTDRQEATRVTNTDFGMLWSDFLPFMGTTYKYQFISNGGGRGISPIVLDNITYNVGLPIGLFEQGLRRIFADQYGYVTYANLSTSTPLPPQTVSSGYAVMLRKDMISLLQKLGIPFSFDLNEVLYTPIEEMVDWNTGDTPPNIPMPDPPPADGIWASDPTPILYPSVTPIAHFNKSYILTGTRLDDVVEYLWTGGGTGDENWWDKLFPIVQNPVETVISIMYFPFDLSRIIPISSLSTINFGNVQSTITAQPISSNYTPELDLGTININLVYGNYLDYDETTVQLYLPYIGFVNLDTRDIMGKDINIKYAIDILNGTFVAMILVDEKIISTHNGNMGISIPSNGRDSQNQQAAVGQSIAQTALTGIAGIGSIIAGIAAPPAAPVAIGMGVGLIGNAIGSANNISEAKKQHNSVPRGGVSSPHSAIYAPNYPYVVIDRPIAYLADNIYNFMGGKSYIFGILANFQGYIECTDVHLDNPNIPNRHVETIKSILKSGVRIQ